MKHFIYISLLVFTIISCTEDEGVNFQPDTFYLNTETTSVNEADGTCEVTFNLSIPNTSDLIINYTVTGTAENTIDYTIPTSSVTILAGEQIATLTISLIDDTQIEEQEDIIITVTDTSNPSLFIDQSDTITIALIDDESTAFQEGILVANYGNTPGTITYISNDFTSTQQQIYNNVNNETVGNGLQAIGFYNNNAYLISTESNKITVVNKYSFLKEASIETVLNNPRHFIASGTKGYVTNWGDPNNSADDFIAVIDLSDNTIEATTIPVPEGPEKIVAINGKLYISHKGGINTNNIISVINTADTTNTSTISVGDMPDEMIFDTANNIWVLCEGKPASSGSETGGQLIKINTSDDTAGTPISFATTAHPNAMNYENGTLYYSVNGAIYSMLETETLLPTTAIITTPVDAIAINNESIFTTDFGNSMTDGTLKVFNLSDNLETQSITVGVIPGGIYFN